MKLRLEEAEWTGTTASRRMSECTQGPARQGEESLYIRELSGSLEVEDAPRGDN